MSRRRSTYATRRRPQQRRRSYHPRRRRTVFSQGSFWFWFVVISGVIWAWYNVAGAGAR
jgi:hypothetical protein